jgi:serine protease Do
MKVLAACVFVMMGSVAFAQNTAPRAKSTNTYAGSHSYLGIGGVDVTDERARSLGLKDASGIEVTSVNEDSPAAKAGIRQGDVILQYNGQPVDGGEQFVRMVRETPAGRKVVMEVWRNGSKQKITAMIGSRQDTPAFVLPAPPAPPIVTIPDIQIPDMPRDWMSWQSPVLGIESESLSSQLAEYFGVKNGVLVRSVLKGSPAETAGLKAGDVIIKINGEPVSSPRNIAAHLRRSGKDVTLTVVRNHKELTLNMKLAHRRPSEDLLNLPL